MKKQKQMLIAGWFLTMLIGTAVFASGGEASSNYQPNALLVVKTEKAKEAAKKKSNTKKTKKAVQKNGGKKLTGKFKVNKKNCARLQRWIDEGTYTRNVLKRGWPYTDDLNGDGVEEHVLETMCNRAGYPVSF